MKIKDDCLERFKTICKPLNKYFIRGYTGLPDFRVPLHCQNHPNHSMEQVITLSLPEFIRKSPSAKSFNNDVIIIETSANDPERFQFSSDDVVRVEALSIFLVLEGSIDITINHTDYHLPANSQLDLIHMLTFRNLRLSPDFRGYNITISKGFLSEVMRESKRLPISCFITRRQNPVQQLPPKEVQLLEEIILRIQRNIDRPHHLHHRDLIMNEIRSLFMEFGDNMVQQLNQQGTLPELPNKEEIISRFLFLLDSHCKEEHSVAFYAEKLCITPEYLSKILKAFSGKTVNKWIDEALMREAQIYMRNLNLSVQQIADALNFSDQSAFGKFFKKHSGMTSVEYRKQF